MPGRRPHLALIAALCWLLAACTEVVEVDIPDHESLLVVEGYVEPDEFFICSLFETVSYFSEPGVPILDSAVVVLSSPDYFTDTLEWIRVHEDIGYYQGHYIIPRDYSTTWRLDVLHTPTGRSAWAETSMHPPQAVDSVGFVEAEDGNKKLIVYFQDTSGRKDHYMYWASESPNGHGVETRHFTDQYFDGMQYAMPTGQPWAPGSFVHVRLLHIHPDYHEFVSTLDQANSIGWDLVQEPLNVRGNVHGALGVFTGFDAPVFPVYVP